ncbi:chalcone isomerase family protein [Ramlibacter sp. PS4R-6]|uniref:chalcone isomerase family protein n=1 Tax=Ramlibacter sp. PS4R-6 TaxID=3133438 RepID=UPI0030B35046
MRFVVRAFAALAAFACITASAQVTLAGAKFDPEANLGGQKLLLNGAGVRFKAMFKVYAIGLYTPKKTTKNDEVLDVKTAKRLQLVALRDVGGDEFGKLFTRALEENATREEFSKSINAVIRMGQIFADQKQFTKGDVVMIDYVPGTGLTITAKNKPAEVFKEPQFSSMMYKIWFGAHPPDTNLQKALLGEQNYTNTNL